MASQQRTLFVTPQYVKENSVFNDNIEDNILRKCISMCEDKYIHPILGTQLTLAITNHINAYVQSGTSIPTNYKILLDEYIIPCLVEYVQVEYLPFTFKFRNKGVSRQTSPESIPAEVDELIYLRQTILANAQFYGTRMVDYLCVNNALYPEYNQVQAGDIVPAKEAYSSSIFIPGKSRGRFKYDRPYTQNPYNQ